MEPSPTPSKTFRIAVFGVGNLLATDEGVGVHVLKSDELVGLEATLVDAGAIGAPLLGTLSEHDGVVIVDASRVDGPPGTVRIFEDEEMDRYLAGHRMRSVHDASLAEMLHAARLTDGLPKRRALVGIEPGETSLGTACTAAVENAIPVAVRAVQALVTRWRHAAPEGTRAPT